MGQSGGATSVALPGDLPTANPDALSRNDIRYRVSVRMIGMSGRDQPLCPGCLKALPAGADFCPRCQTPSTVKATTDPYLSLLAEASAYRKASQVPHKPIVLIGMWLLWGPTLALCALGVIWFCAVASLGLLDELFQNEFSVVRLFKFLACVALLAVVLVYGLLVSGTLVYRTTQNYFKRHRNANKFRTSGQHGWTSGSGNRID
ncbi:MAG: hypothetical protein AB7U73_02965 [Pirellulales bacterium]